VIITSYGPGLRKPSAGGGAGGPSNFFIREFLAKTFGTSAGAQYFVGMGNFPFGSAVEQACGYYWVADLGGNVYEISPTGVVITHVVTNPLDIAIWGNPATTGIILIAVVGLTGSIEVHGIVGGPGLRVLLGNIAAFNPGGIMTGIPLGIAVDQTNGDVWVTEYSGGGPGSRVHLLHLGGPGWLEDAASPYVNAGNDLVDCCDIAVDANGRAWFADTIDRMCYCNGGPGAHTVQTIAVNNIMPFSIIPPPVPSVTRIVVEPVTNSVFFTERVGGPGTMKIGKIAQPGLTYTELDLGASGFLAGIVVHPTTGDLWTPQANGLLVYKVTQLGVVTTYPITTPGWQVSMGHDAQLSTFGGVPYVWWDDMNGNDFFNKWFMGLPYDTLFSPTAGKAAKVKSVCVIQRGSNDLKLDFITSAKLIARQFGGKSLYTIEDVQGAIDEPVKALSTGSSDWFIVIGYDEV